MRAVSFAVVRRYLDFQVGRALDHMLISHDVAGWIDNEPGSETLQCLPNLARPSAVITKKLRVKIFDRITHRTANHTLGIDVDHAWQNFRDSPARRLRRRIALVEARCRSCQREDALSDPYHNIR